MTLLPRLVDKSLVSTSGQVTRRYRLLETIRIYAAERLAAGASEPDVRQRHANHYLALAERAAEQLRTSDQRTWRERLTTEQPNLRAAMAHTVATGDIESAWRSIETLQRFWEITGRRREADEWIQRALAIGDPPATPTVVRGLAAASEIVQPANARAAFDLANRAARLADGLDDFSRGRAAGAVGTSALWIQPQLVQPAFHEALARFGDDHPWETATTLQGLTQSLDDLTEALDRGRRSVDLFRGVGDDTAAANTLFIMAQRSIYAGIADDEVHSWLTESQALADAAGNEEDRVHAMVGFGQLAWLRGEHDHATRLMQSCLPTLRRRGDQRCTGRALYLLGERAREQQQLTRAHDLLTASINAVSLAGQSYVLVSALEALADVLNAQNHPWAAAVLLGSAHTARTSANPHMRPTQPPDDQLRRALVHVLGRTTFDTAHSQGERASTRQALRIASAQSGPQGEMHVDSTSTQ